MPELESFYQNNKHNNSTVLGVTFEATPIDKIRAFVLILGVTYPILSSGQNPITPFGEVRVLPTTFIIDPAGKLFHKIEGTVTEKDLQHIIDEANLTTMASTTGQYSQMRFSKEKSHLTRMALT
jgi:peroxiredoxin